MLPEAEYIAALRRLKLIMPFDKNADAQTGEYWVRSLYFDDMQNSALWDKMDGIYIRKKFRMRTYNFLTDIIMLEKKTKNGLLRGKETIALDPSLVKQILSGDIDWMLNDDEAIIREMAMDIRTRRLHPVIMTDYSRQALVFPAGNVRITFDRLITTGPYNIDIFDENRMPVPVLPPNRIIMEIKYEHILPPHIRGIIQSISAVRESISKYALSRQYQY